MKLCEQCPDHPSCTLCTEKLGAGTLAKKVIPPRIIRLTHLMTEISYIAELRAVSRVSLGVAVEVDLKPGRYEVQLSSDYRIIANAVGGIRSSEYHVFDIEKVLRKQESLERLFLDDFQKWHLSHELDVRELTDELLSEEEEKERIFQLYVDRLSVLRQLKDIRMFTWEANQVRALGPYGLESEFMETIQDAIGQVLHSQVSKRLQGLAKDSKELFDIHVLPLTMVKCGIVLLNMTEAVQAERERREREWNLYKRVIGFATNQKLVLLQDEEMFGMILEASHIGSIDVTKPEDLAGLRQLLRDALQRYAIPTSKLLHMIVAINEAASNTLIHGKGGRVDLYWKEGRFFAIVTDEGQGIDLAELPNATLVPGYSTKHSLGAGFQVMLQYADRLYMSSSSQGTKIALEIALEDLN